MTLIDEIKENSVTPGFPMPDLLRKILILGYKLENDDLSNWVNKELNGYEQGDSLPDYRKIQVNCMGNFRDSFSQMNRVKLFEELLPENFRHWIRDPYPVQNSVSSLENILNSNEAIMYPWPTPLIAQLSSPFERPMNCLSAWHEIPCHMINQIVDTVKTRMLNFTLEIERDLPDPRAWNERILPVTKEKQDIIFNTTITGGTNILAQSSSHFSQQITPEVKPGNLESLVGFLSKQGLVKEEAEKLQAAIVEDSVSGEPRQIGDKVKEWLLNIKEGINAGTIAVGTKVTADLISRAIFLYYGIPS